MRKKATKTDDGAFRVSHSKIGVWLKCRYAYFLKYVEKLRRRRKARPLQFGIMVHDMLEAWIEGDDPFEVLAEMEKKQGKLFRSEVEEYGDIVEDVGFIMTEYFNYWDEKSLVFMRKKGKGAEFKFEVEIAPGIKLVGKIDAIGKTPNKLRWLVEHKSHATIPNEDHRWRNIQSSIYIRVNDMLGWEPVDGTVWDYIRSKPPTAPKLLKSGKMSEKQLDTLPAKVFDVLEKHKLDPVKFKTLLKGAEQNRSRYFQRIFTPKKKRVIDILFGQMIETAQDMADLHGKTKVKTIARHCEWCEYEPICRAELKGLDVSMVKEKEYYVDEEDHSQDWQDAATEAG